jgi:dipicolinate synthase subunit A
MMEDKAVLTKNAVPTSEGVLAYLINAGIKTIAKSRVLIIGYGLCGSDLAARLRRLDACVFTLVRNKEKEAAALKDGITPVYFKDFCGALPFDIIINTVPATIFGEEFYEQTAGAILVDIASKPHGFDMPLAKKFNEKSATISGIPGKYAKKTAGIILGEFVKAILEEEKEKIKERERNVDTWI